MKTFATILLFLLTTLLPAQAQERAWVQIEAHPTQTTAEERSRAYAGLFPNVAAYRIPSGWYAIALGPYTPDQAESALRRLRGERLIPGDSFLNDGTSYGQPVWPIGAAPTVPVTPAPVTPAPVAEAQDPTALPEETPAEARRSERDLDRGGRIEIQTALQWEGFYTSTIDAAFGPGTRRSMADWQASRGYEPTGVLTSRQRAELIAHYRKQIDFLGLREIEEAEAGIRIRMPMNLVDFDRYEPPFVHFESRDDSGVRVLLISQRGNQATLFGLYDIMQTLKVVPLQGERQRQTNQFTITGRNAEIESYTYATLTGGAVKGFSLIWKRGEQDELMKKVAQIMRDSFEALPNAALDQTMAEIGAEQRADMMSGLEIRQPDSTRTGVFVDAEGTVLTAAPGLTACSRITIGSDLPATLGARDTALGLVLLHPITRLAPIDHARFKPDVPRLRSEVSVAGFSYGEVLDLPVLTRGTLADLRGLNGEETVDRLEIQVLPGDTGGAALDAAGAVIGILLAPQEGPRQLPENVRYVADTDAIIAFLTANGVEPDMAEGQAALPPAQLNRRAADITVPVSCWN
ncbi:hypothetical protein RGUI_1182 [Rhodovulum sp. P5]|uniref:trypsin-like peptidase domain-containing protein n=1 Tax=Rhodovulum sp. P5 TaxID=1564506 RepID=UPI0009C25D8C|nr:trypsin-like peptidase domain-containing protein [Rhodovulum sp. P5]ARE39323.1 hypothetical protein RGUI_1182 [Rhodovulum sp. P5]